MTTEIPDAATPEPRPRTPESPTPESPTPPKARFARRVAAPVVQAYLRLISTAISLYGTAVLRIGYGSAYLAFLLHEYPHHDALWGPNAPWTPALNKQFADDPSLDWFAVDRWWYTFLGHGGRTWFEFWYHAAILICLLFALGWRTRATSIMFALTIMAFTGRNVFLTDGGDNIMSLMAIYLAFTCCGRRWSLDAAGSRAAMPSASRSPGRTRPSAEPSQNSTRPGPAPSTSCTIAQSW